MLFQFADASTVPLLSQEIGKSKAAHSSLQISGLIISTQLVVMLLAPWVGYLSEGYGRKPLLLLGFGVCYSPFRAVHGLVWQRVCSYSAY